MSEEPSIVPYKTGDRVVVLDGPYRGKIGFVRGHKSMEYGGNRIERPIYLVTDIYAEAAGDWWAEVWHHDLTRIGGRP